MEPATDGLIELLEQAATQTSFSKNVTDNWRLSRLSGNFESGRLPSNSRVPQSQKSVKYFITWVFSRKLNAIKGTLQGAF